MNLSIYPSNLSTQLPNAHIRTEVEWKGGVDSSGIPVCREIPQEPATRKLTQRPRKAAPPFHSTLVLDVENAGIHRFCVCRFFVCELSGRSSTEIILSSTETEIYSTQIHIYSTQIHIYSTEVILWKLILGNQPQNGAQIAHTKKVRDSKANKKSPSNEEP